MPGPVWMGVSCTHRGLNRPSLYRLRSPSPLPLNLKSSAQIAVARGCQNERYTHARTRTFHFGVQESEGERSCLSPI